LSHPKDEDKRNRSKIHGKLQRFRQKEKRDTVSPSRKEVGRGGWKKSQKIKEMQRVPPSARGVR